MCNRPVPLNAWFFLGALVLLCHGCGSSGSDGSAYTPDPDVFTKEPDSELLASVTDTYGREHLFPTNQLILVLSEGVEAQEAERLSEELSVRIVGQFPEIGVYQLETDTQNEADLETIAQELENSSAVESVGFNYLGHARGNRDIKDCKSQDDLDDLLAGDRCAFENVQYYQYARIMDEVKEHITLSKVKVAVLDTGLDGASQFTDADVRDLESDQFFIFTDADGHGTMVAGMIAADNKDGSVNGVASRVLGDKLTLYFGGKPHLASATMARYAWLAAKTAKVQAVNMSFGYGSANPPKRFSAVRKKWKRLMKRFPETLFIPAADNNPYELTTQNDAPAGIQLPNVITVGGNGGADGCDPLEEYADSSWGPLIDITATARNVPVMDPSNPDGAHLLVSGNSLAAPVITSLAAILVSIKPNIAINELRSYILDHTYLTSEKVNYRRLVLPTPILQLIIDKGGAPTDLLRNIDRQKTGTPDPAGMIVNRLCDASYLDVEGLGMTYFFDNEEEAGSYANAMGFSIGMIPAEDSIFMLGSTSMIPRIGAGTSMSIPGEVQAGYQHPNYMAASGVSGTMEITSCAIIERDGWRHLPLMVQMEGKASGVLEGIVPPDTPGVQKNFTTEFNIYTVTMLNSAEEPLAKLLEATCHGGIR